MSTVGAFLKRMAQYIRTGANLSLDPLTCDKGHPLSLECNDSLKFEPPNMI